MLIPNLLIRLAGHDPRALDGHDYDDAQLIKHSGWTVLPALIVTSLNWAGAGYALAANTSGIGAVSAAVLCGTIGFLVVIAFDRAALYALDTQTNGVFAKSTLIAARLAIVLLISSVTTQAVAPLWLGPELAEHALQLREEADRDRSQRLAAQLDLPRLRITADRAEDDVTLARHSAETVPAPIKSRMAAARRCWSGYERRSTELRSQGKNDIEARHILQPIAARCAGMVTAARRELEAYQRKADSLLLEAETRANDSKGTLDEAEKSIKARLKEASGIEKTAISAQSSVVLEGLLNAHVGAQRKWWTIFLAITFIELMALILKVMSGTSASGARIAADRQISIASHVRRRRVAADETKVEDALRTTMSSAMLEALSRPEVRNDTAQLFAGKIGALVPIEVFKSVIREIEAQELDVASAIKRHPNYARIITEAWQMTLDEVLARLRALDPAPQP